MNSSITILVLTLLLLLLFCVFLKKSNTKCTEKYPSGKRYDQVETIWNILFLLSILSESADPDTFKGILNELVNVFVVIDPEYSNTYNKYLSKYIINGPKNNLYTSSNNMLTYTLLAIKTSIDKELSQDDVKSIHFLYSYWIKRENKKKLLQIYINNLKLNPDIPDNLFTLINNIKLIDYQ